MPLSAHPATAPTASSGSGPRHPRRIAPLISPSGNPCAQPGHDPAATPTITATSHATAAYGMKPSARYGAQYRNGTIALTATGPPNQYRASLPPPQWTRITTDGSASATSAAITSS